MRKLLMLSIMAMFLCSPLFAADIRIVGNVRVDLQAIHDWQDSKGKPKDQPMKQWKAIKIQAVVPGGPWPTCTILVEKVHKTVYLKNLPASALIFINATNRLQTQINALSREISNDTKNLRVANTVDAEYGSQYAVNRDRFSANLENKKDRLDELNREFAQLKARGPSMTSEFALFTGQVYNKLEVWDCGLKQ